MNKKIKICFDNESELDLLSLPFKSAYRVLSWRGESNGANLVPDFAIADIEGKFIVIKSLKLIPYNRFAQVDIYLTDGATVNRETIPVNGRIDRLFDIFGSGTNINLRINGGQVNLFNAVFPLDADLQNIYFKYPEKVQTLDLGITGQIFNDIETSNITTCNLIVNMEVYLI